MTTMKEPSGRHRPHDLCRGGCFRRLRTIGTITLLGIMASGLSSGCRGVRSITKTDDKYELLTAELRTRERELLEARSELQHLRLLTQTYQRQQCPPPIIQGSPVFRTDAGVPVLPLKEISLGTGTGGVNDDQQPGSESLMVVIVPKDDDGTAIKVPAQVMVRAYEISPEGLKTPIGKWDVGAEPLRATWRSGLLSSGYFVPLQWDKLPVSGRVRVVAQLRTLDGQLYEADKDITVQPLPGAGVRGPITLPVPAFPLDPTPSGVEQLPLPKSDPGPRP